MNSEFFPQYLFNTNQVNGEKIIFLLKQAAKSEASLAVRVLRKYSIRPEQFMEILPLNDKEAEEKLLEAKIVDEKGLAALRSESGDVGLPHLYVPAGAISSHRGASLLFRSEAHSVRAPPAKGCSCGRIGRRSGNANRGARNGSHRKA